MRSYKYFVVEKRPGVALATIHNPPYNFLRTGMIFELSDILDRFENDSDVSAIVITGGVKGYFIAHADFERVVTQTQPDNPRSRELHDMWHNTFDKMHSSSKVIIAAVNGPALGGGCELALACDIRFMARDAVIGLFEVKAGAIPGAGGTQRLVRFLGISRALPLLLEGRIMSAQEAESIGLVHKTLEPDQLMEYSVSYAQAFAKRPTLAIQGIKRCVYQGIEVGLKQGLEIEREVFYKTVPTEYSRNKLNEALQAYKQGRRPEAYWIEAP